MTLHFLLADTTVPFADMLTQAANAWLLSKGGLFLTQGMGWVMLMGKILIGIVAIRFAIEVFSGGTGEGAIPFAAYRLARWVIVLWLMRYYNTPIDMFGGVSFHQMIPEEARQLLLATNDDSLKTALGTVNSMEEKSDEQADWWGPGEKFSAEVIGWMVSFFNGVMLLLSCGGYVLEAIAVTVGPLSIPWLTFDGTSWLFWDWLQFLISASMYQVIGAILVNIWASVMVLAGPYFLSLSIVNMALLFAALNIAIFISALGIPWITSTLYGKGAGAAANLAHTVAGGVASVARGAAAAAAATL